MEIIKPNKVTSDSDRNVMSALLPYIPGPSYQSAETNYYNASYPLSFIPIGPESATPNNAVTANGRDAIVLVYGRTLHAVQVSGTFVGEVTVEATLDRTLSVWEDLDVFTEASMKQYSGIYFAFRFRITAYTSGSIQIDVLTQR